jgi:hypothetical protein
MRKPTVPDVLPMVRAYRAKHGVGGSLHNVLEDGNVKTRDIAFCVERAQKAGDLESVQLGEMLLAMSQTQRKKISEHCD